LVVIIFIANCYNNCHIEPVEMHQVVFFRTVGACTKTPIARSLPTLSYSRPTGSILLHIHVWNSYFSTGQKFYYSIAKPYKRRKPNWSALNRICIFTKQVQLITGKSDKTSRAILNKTRK